jgi:predicted membrane channel-forming protein YqfA (hemolysin III family)
MEKMQQWATKLFIVASVTFGVVGLLMVLTEPRNNESPTDFFLFTSRLLMALVFLILPSFALSVAGKYLSKK